MSGDSSVSHVSAGIKPSELSEVSKKLETWIVIQRFDGPFFVKINQSTTVYNIKQQITQEPIPITTMKIITNQSTLADNAIVWNYKDTKLYCVLESRKMFDFLSSNTSIHTNSLVHIMR